MELKPRFPVEHTLCLADEIVVENLKMKSGDCPTERLVEPLYQSGGVVTRTNQSPRQYVLGESHSHWPFSNHIDNACKFVKLIGSELLTTMGPLVTERIGR